MIGPKVRECDVCDGSGVEVDEDDLDSVDLCNLCEGAGGFDEDGDPADDNVEHISGD